MFGIDSAQILAALGLHAGAPGGEVYGPPQPDGTPPKAVEGAGISLADMAPMLQGLLGNQQQKPTMSAPAAPAIRGNPGAIVSPQFPSSNPGSIRNRM